ncbi:hypothetical protein ACFCZ1_03230 [Streptomyces sp. NPDC056224]
MPSPPRALLGLGRTVPVPAYDSKLDVDFTLPREGDPNAVGLDQAA